MSVQGTASCRKCGKQITGSALQNVQQGGDALCAGNYCFEEAQTALTTDRIREKQLRDHFAMAALQGFVARGESGQGYAERVARMSFNLADAMMKERVRD